MAISDHVRGAPSPTGMVHRDLGKTDEGYRVFVVSWRGAFYRISVRRQPRGLVLGGGVPAPYTLDAVIARSHEDGSLDEESNRIEEGELLEELRAQARIFGSWGGA